MNPFDKTLKAFDVEDFILSDETAKQLNCPRTIKDCLNQDVYTWLDLRFTKDAPIHYVLSELRKIIYNKNKV